jgi:hypothetical protein
MTFNQLKSVTNAANNGQGTITLKNFSGLTAQQLYELLVLAPGRIAFDFTN